jgi:hypothetical protein
MIALLRADRRQRIAGVEEASEEVRVAGSVDGGEERHVLGHGDLLSRGV